MAPSESRSRRSWRPDWRCVAWVAVLAACFLYFNLDSLWVPFSEDDMMNLDGYWRPSPWRALAGNLMPWSSDYRPLGALFYLPIFHIFGLNPLPFHAVILVLLAVNVWLTWRFARVLGAGIHAAGMAALGLCYHVGLANLYYLVINVYDVLCFTFYVGAVIWYARVRKSGRGFRGIDAAIFFALFLCALNAKEIAATLPLVLLAYEWIYHGRPKWRGHPVLLACAALAAVYVAGRVFGAGGISATAGYGVKLSMHRVWEMQRTAWRDLLALPAYPGRAWVVVLWCALFYFAWRRHSAVLRFGCLWLLFSQLPLNLLLARGQAALYVPLAGFAVFAGTLAVEAARAAARALAREPVFQWFRQEVLFTGLLLGAALLWVQHNHAVKTQYTRGAMNATGGAATEVIRQLREMRPTVPPRSRVVFLNDPFQDFDMALIADLWFRDRTLEFRLNRKTPLDEQAIAAAGAVFDFRDGKLMRLR